MMSIRLACHVYTFSFCRPDERFSAAVFRLQSMSSMCCEFRVSEYTGDERRGIYKRNKQGPFSILVLHSLNTAIGHEHYLSTYPLGLARLHPNCERDPLLLLCILQLTRDFWSLWGCLADIDVRSSNQYPNYDNSGKLLPYRLRAHCQSSTSPIARTTESITSLMISCFEG